METMIWIRDGYRNINPDYPPKEIMELNSFLEKNNAPKCFFKIQGNWYKRTKTGEFLFVTKTLYLLSLKEWLDIALDDNFEYSIYSKPK